MKRVLLLITIMLIFITGCELKINNDEYDSSYSDEKIGNAIRCTARHINIGKYLSFYDETSILMIPLDEDYSCAVGFRKADNKYAYIGVRYNNSIGTYYYSFIAKNDKTNVLIESYFEDPKMKEIDNEYDYLEEYYKNTNPSDYYADINLLGKSKILFIGNVRVKETK